MLPNINLTYRFLNCTPELSQHETRNAIVAALGWYSAVTRLTFRTYAEGPTNFSLSDRLRKSYP